MDVRNEATDRAVATRGLADDHRAAAASLSQDFRWAYFILRAATGVDLFGHGFIRLAGHMSAFHQWLLDTFAKSILPDFVVGLTGWALPPIELILGALLILGYRTRETLLAASLVMIGLITGSCLIQNWEIVSLQLFYVLVYAVLLAFRSSNFICLDKTRS